MKNTYKSKARIILTSVLSALLCTVFAVLSFSADYNFESEIAEFPESYKPYLRELHKAHPNWEFEAFKTGLDFNDVIDNEIGAKSLVSESASSNTFKSKAAGDYNYATDKYIYKDGGFVEANRLAVAFFIDPRNFLNDEGIFMFESLAFNDSFTVSAVENVLSGSFMHNKNITYYNSKGKKISTSTKYSTAIFNAGKTHNINPCFLASKILNEVGSTGSSSVSGKHSTYPGIYNFYNIGASDGEGAIGRGLKWAKTAGSYGRPWNTPVKSINGGAEFLVESYIACGQFTGYLQRFNVNPDNTKHNVYTHQYMTNLTGALSQGRSTYRSYLNTGLLENKYVFSIPVYENMPSETISEGYGSLADSDTVVIGDVNVTSCSVRKGPSTDYGKLTTSGGADIKLSKGQRVTVLEKMKTDATYYLSLLQYPFWYKVSFTYGGTVYEGYVPENFILIATQTRVGVGVYDPEFVVSNDEIDMHLESFNSNVAQITSDNKIKFLKAGTVTIAAYDSLGRFDKVRYNVTADASVTVKNSYISNITPRSCAVYFSLDSGKSYEFTAKDLQGNIVHSGRASYSPYTVTGLKGGNTYNITVRTILDDSTVKRYGPAVLYTVNTIPDTITVTGLIKDNNGNYTVKWNSLKGAAGYEISAYDVATDTFTPVAEAAANATSYVISAAEAEKLFFTVRAFGVYGGERIYGEYSPTIDIRKIPADITGVKVDGINKNGYTIRWDKQEGVSYNLYKKSGNSYKFYKSVAANAFTETNTGASYVGAYKISAFTTVSGIIYEGAACMSFSTASIPADIKNLKVKSNLNGGRISWDKVKNATEYRIYLYDYSSGEYVQKAYTKSTSYTVSDGKIGQSFKYRVRAVIKTTSGTSFGNYADITVTPRPEKVDDIKSTETLTTVTLKWSASEGADKYYIYRYDSKKKKYNKVAAVKTTSYKAAKLKAGSSYRFRVYSVAVVNGKEITNASETFLVGTKPSKIKKVKVSSRNKTNMTLSWSKVSGAERYQVYKYDSKKKKYVRVATVKSTKYKVKGLKKGKSYKFKIRSVNIAGGKNYYGSYSSVYKFKTKS